MRQNKRLELMDILDKNTLLQEYLFRRGFLFTSNSMCELERFPFYGNWNKCSLGKYSLYTHKDTHAYSYEVEKKCFFLIGHAYNPFTMEKNETKILETIANSAKETRQDLINELTGIYVIGWVEEECVEFQVDASGMQSAYYGYVNSELYITSHFQLVADLCDLKMSAIAKELVNYKWYHRVMGDYLPGDITAFDELKRVVPSIHYCYTQAEFKHRRIYPTHQNDICRNDDEYTSVIAQSADILKKNVELVVEKWDNPHISLTGGIDSNTTFAAGNGMYERLKTFTYISAEKETIDAVAARKISEHFKVEQRTLNIPEEESSIPYCNEIVKIIEHNNGYVIKRNANEYRKRVFLIQQMPIIGCDVEVKSWTSETIRAYWYKHYGRKTMPKLSAKLFRNLYKIFITNRKLAHKVDKIFERYIKEFEYEKIDKNYPAADMHYNEVTWGSWGGPNISEMKMYSDITIIYNNRKLLDLLFRVPLEKRISDQHHLDMKEILNKELFDMNIRVVNMKETRFRAAMLNVIFTINMILPF